MPEPAGLDVFRNLLNDRVLTADIVSDLEPPHHFSDARFSNYKPEEQYPSQNEALDKLHQFVSSAQAPYGRFERIARSLIGRKHVEQTQGIYLDGGFGVGKTHLLAATYYAYKGRKAYLSFQELMFAVGLQKLEGTFTTFANYELLLLDEFELDDPANTRIASNLLQKLMDRGVRIVTTSNTPPGAWGKDRFSIQDFERELHDLARRFEVIRIDGEDYRTLHQHMDRRQASWCNAEDAGFGDLERKLLASSLRPLSLRFEELIDIISKAHPMRIRKALTGFDALVLKDLTPIGHPNEALRFVYFIDKAYDQNLQLLVSSPVLPTDIFAGNVLNGGDVKKYRRTISRIREMTEV